PLSPDLLRSCEAAVQLLTRARRSGSSRQSARPKGAWTPPIDRVGRLRRDRRAIPVAWLATRLAASAALAATRCPLPRSSTGRPRRDRVVALAAPLGQIIAGSHQTAR